MGSECSVITLRAAYVFERGFTFCHQSPTLGGVNPLVTAGIGRLDWLFVRGCLNSGNPPDHLNTHGDRGPPGAEDALVYADPESLG